MERLRPAALLQSPGDSESSSTFLMSSARVSGDAVKTVNTLQPTSMALKYNHDPSAALTKSEQAKATLALSPSITPAHQLQLRYADRKARLTRPGWVKKERPIKMERPSAATAQTKEHLICHDCYIRGRMAPECILPKENRSTSWPTMRVYRLRRKYRYPPPHIFVPSSGFAPQIKTAS